MRKVPDAVAGSKALTEESSKASISISASSGPSTPWGKADHETVYDEGIVFYDTPSHGGFYLTTDKNALVPSQIRRRNNWYEEDCEWAFVCAAFPQLFTDWEKQVARGIVKAYYPEIHGVLYND